MKVYNYRLLFNVLVLLVVTLSVTQAFWSTKKEEAPAANTATATAAATEEVQVPEKVSEGSNENFQGESGDEENFVEEQYFPEDEEFEGEQFNDGEEEFFDETGGRTDLHFAAAEGSFETCEAILGEEDAEFIHHRDDNGWQAIHEAVREGHTHIVRLLIDRGADIGAVTNTADTPLSLARDSLEEGHEVILLLEELGAPDADRPPADEEQFDGEESEHFEENHDEQA